MKTKYILMGILASNYDIAWLPNFAQIIKDAMAARTSPGRNLQSVYDKAPVF